MNASSIMWEGEINHQLVFKVEIGNGRNELLEIYRASQLLDPPEFGLAGRHCTKDTSNPR